jgi:hypothetical protein
MGLVPDFEEMKMMDQPSSDDKPVSFIVRPATTVPANSDPLFMEVRRELSDKGFFTAAAEELIIWARTVSLMWMTFGWPAARSK